MNKELSNFAARLLPLLRDTARQARDIEFNELALELFALQFQNNPVYQEICRARGLTQRIIEHWTQTPAVPTAAFKELELTCLAPGERTAVFHSSGTTEQKPSRHYHCPESLKLYEASLSTWFLANVMPDLRFTNYDLRSSKNPDIGVEQSAISNRQSAIFLTPPPAQAPHSSLVHMFETVRQKIGAAETAFVGKIAADSSWTVDFGDTLAALSPKSQTPNPRPQTPDPKPRLLLGTAFSFVHLLDFLEEKDLRFELPAGSRVMETGGYKNRSRAMPKTELHALITERLGVPPENIICEYGMSELSSQAYDTKLERRSPTRRVGVHASACRPNKLRLELQQHRAGSETGAPLGSRHFHFPPWARAQIVSPETGREVADGETGLIRIFDLANVFSVMAIQTEDLGVRHGEGFELIGRAQLAEPRGCSLMTA